MPAIKHVWKKYKKKEKKKLFLRNKWKKMTNTKKSKNEECKWKNEKIKKWIMKLKLKFTDLKTLL